jgi:hypothetical protein
MPQSIPNAAQPAGRLFANRSSADRPTARFSLALRPFLTRLSLVSRSTFTDSFPLAVAHRSAKYFRITCVDDFHFRSKYIPAARARGTSYAFENKIESRKLLQNQMHGPRSKKRGPMESNTCTPSGVGGAGGWGGSSRITFVRWQERERVALRAILTRVSNIAQFGRGMAGRLLFEAKAHTAFPSQQQFPKEGPAVLEAPGPIFISASSSPAASGQRSAFRNGAALTATRSGQAFVALLLRMTSKNKHRSLDRAPPQSPWRISLGKGGTAVCADERAPRELRSFFRGRNSEGGNSERKRDALKAATLVGILLIVVGVIGFAVGGVSFTHRKKDVDMGPVQISHNKTETVPISPILSTVALIGGIGLVVVGARS